MIINNSIEMLINKLNFLKVLNSYYWFSIGFNMFNLYKLSSSIHYKYILELHNSGSFKHLQNYMNCFEWNTPYMKMNNIAMNNRLESNIFKFDTCPSSLKHMIINNNIEMLINKLNFLKALNSYNWFSINFNMNNLHKMNSLIR